MYRYLNKNKDKKTGRTYLRIMHSYHDKVIKKSRTITIESLGYLDELEKKYDDPIAFFEKKVRQMNEQRAAEKFILKRHHRVPRRITSIDYDVEKGRPEKRAQHIVNLIGEFTNVLSSKGHAEVMRILGFFTPFGLNELEEQLLRSKRECGRLTEYADIILSAVQERKRLVKARQERQVVEVDE